MSTHNVVEIKWQGVRKTYGKQCNQVGRWGSEGRGGREEACTVGACRTFFTVFVENFLGKRVNFSMPTKVIMLITKKVLKPIDRFYPF